MNKKRSNNKVTIHTDLTKEILTQVLIDAKKATKKDEMSRRIEAKTEWKAALGLKDNLSGLKKYWNDITCITKLLAFPKKYQNKNNAIGTRFLMTAFISLVFILAELFCVFAVIYQFYIVLSTKSYLNLFQVSLFSLLLILISRFFRMARYEVEDFSDKESLYLVFSAVVSFIAMIFTVASSKW